MVDHEKLWKAIADVKFKMPHAAETIQDYLESIVDSEQRKVEGARTAEDLFESRGRWINARGIADTWGNAESKLRAHLEQ